MARVIDQIQAKITRAKQHIQDLDLALKSFQDTHPYHIGFKEDTDLRQRSYYVSRVDDLPPNLEPIASDAVHNLRSCLDNIVFQLFLQAVPNPTANELKSIYYPICTDPSHYPSVRGKIKSIGKAAVDEIDATEPYKGGKGHALWQLNELDNADKHRLLLKAEPIFQGMPLSRFLPEIASDTTDNALAQMVSMERVVLSQVFIRPAVTSLNVGDVLFVESLDAKVKDDHGIYVAVAFDHPGVISGEPVLKALHEFAHLVEGIVIALSRRLA